MASGEGEQVRGPGVNAGSEVRQAIVGAMVGLLYGSVLAFLALFLFGGGGAHGTSIPLLLSSAPLSVFALVGKLVGEPYVDYGYKATVLGTPLVWAAFGSLVALSGRSRLRLFRILALLHYASGLALIVAAREEPARLERLLQISPELVMWAMIYLAGQAALWSSMRVGSESRRAIVGALVGLLYGSILAFLSLGAGGGGHGTIVPLLLSSAPLGVLFLVGKLVGASHVGDAILFAMLYGAPLIWAALGSLVALSGRGTRLRLTRVLVLLQYMSGLALVAMTAGGLEDVPADLKRAAELVVMWATVYLVGQVALWWRITRRNQLRPTA
jgi:hypothetical protein